MSGLIEPASFRDPGGFVFERDGAIYRQVQAAGAADYDRLMSSGLYETLAGSGRLIRHTEEDPGLAAVPSAHRVLKPEPVPFISYPYEWCFSQLRDAALATLDIQKEALAFGQTLKDATAYNIQYVHGKPVLIDTLSFEEYVEGSPWRPYRQFCQHFLAPLALMSYSDVRLGGLLRLHIDGVPLDLASRLLPGRTRLNPGLLAHIHVHGAAQKRFGGEPLRTSSPGRGMSRTALMGLLDSLETTVRKFAWIPAGTTWADYYQDNNYSQRAMAAKSSLVAEMLTSTGPARETVWDLGANTGLFSRVAAEHADLVVAWDVDPAAVERNYLQCRVDGSPRILPLVQDLTNPSPNLGWALAERRSLAARGPAEVVLALALIHHLAIGNNVPLGHVTRFLRSLGRWAIVEFVPKSDSQVKRLLASREDIFPDYSEAGFEAALAPYFDVCRRAGIAESERTLYLLRRRGEIQPDETRAAGDDRPLVGGAV